MTIQEWIELTKTRAEQILSVDPHCLRGKYAREIIKFLNEIEKELSEQL